ncbi:hypothetical protein FGG08_005552 [Glutinoglossum americanum]|uniref:Dienelactone hydrolase domain-containing protein n=1 Tax=Glutinoglossum americanum TaxID=1670608 RepID=A0A9P8I2S5_9PEZI|nr:hypothetical protein FGG08_005552 [Glutinoglossum americanum]
MSVPICTDCVSGVIHSGTPKGRTATVHGLDTYIAGPPDGRPPKGLVVVIADVFGWGLTNVRVLADVYAEKGGFLVYVPDFLKGHAVDPAGMSLVDRIMAPSGILGYFSKAVVAFQILFRLIPFLIYNGDSSVLPTVINFFRSCRETEGQALKIGAAGFCFGGRFAILLAHNDERFSTADGKPLIDVAFTGHPSMVKVPKEYEGVRLPLGIAVGSLDTWMSAKQIVEVRNILDKEPRVEHEVVVYEGAKHGFAVRGDPGNEEEIKRGIEAEDQAVAWFTRFFGQA